MTNDTKTSDYISKKREKQDQLIDLVRKAPDDFYAYVMVMAPVMMPGEFKNGRHIKVICKELQKIEKVTAKNFEKTGSSGGKASDKVGERLQVFLPPGAMKTVLCSILYPSWILGKHPNWRILAIGHGTKFAEDTFGRPIRDLMKTDQYKLIFPGVTLRTDVKAAGRFQTNKKGIYQCAGATAGIAGKRGHITICDDVIDEQDAISPTIREKVNKWYVPGLRSRLLPGGSEIIVNTRWHKEDLSGSRLKADKNSDKPWKVISVPALLDEAGSKLLKEPGDPEGWYDEGTTYWPEYWPTNLFLEKKNDPTLSPSQWSALYMQNPIPEEGTVIKYSDFKLWESPNIPDVDFIVASIDPAYSEKQSADFTAISIWGVFSKEERSNLGNDYKTNNLILLACSRNRIDYPSLIEKMGEVNEKYLPDLFLIENQASGRALIPDLRRRGFPVEEAETGTKDKLTRLIMCQPHFTAGRIFVPASFDPESGEYVPSEFVQPLIEEVCSFPYVDKDDYTDTVSQVVNWLRTFYNLKLEAYSDFDGYEDEEPPFQGRNSSGSYWDSILNS